MLKKIVAIIEYGVFTYFADECVDGKIGYLFNLLNYYYLYRFITKTLNLR